MNKWMIAPLAVGVLGVGIGAAEMHRRGNSDDIAVSICEFYLKESIKTPSTYERISADMSSNYVLIEYDAQNGFGATIRDSFSCDYNFYNGEFVLKQRLGSDAQRQLVEMKTRQHFQKYPIPVDETALAPTKDEIAIDACVQAAIDTDRFGSM